MELNIDCFGIYRECANCLRLVRQGWLAGWRAGSRLIFLSTRHVRSLPDHFLPFSVPENRSMGGKPSKDNKASIVPPLLPNSFRGGFVRERDKSHSFEDVSPRAKSHGDFLRLSLTCYRCRYTKFSMKLVKGYVNGLGLSSRRTVSHISPRVWRPPFFLRESAKSSRLKRKPTRLEDLRDLIW